MSWLNAAEALELLGVRPQTLYANVSRKRIRAKPDPRDTRRSLYYEADVRKLAHQHGARRKAAAVAAATIEWGDPILSSAVSTLSAGRLWYRGVDAVALSEDETLEYVAALLWGAESVDLCGLSGAADAIDARGSFWNAAGSALQRGFYALGRRAATDSASFGRSLPVLRAEAASVVRTLIDALLPRSRRSAALHSRVAAAWRRPKAADVVRRTLVLVADHELNASTFATRVAVSTGAPLSAAVLGGLATLSGPLHGRASLGVLELILASRRLGPENAVRDRLAQGQPFAGFGHPLYPTGDVRAAALLREFEVPAEYARLRDIVEDAIGEPPNIDFALAAMTQAYGFPKEAPLMLFTLGRCVGWLAHALEQVSTGRPIRPRANYVGPAIPLSSEA